MHIYCKQSGYISKWVTSTSFCYNFNSFCVYTEKSKRKQNDATPARIGPNQRRDNHKLLKIQGLDSAMSCMQAGTQEEPCGSHFEFKC